MNHQFLDFEQPIAELRAKIDELRHVSDDGSLNLAEEIVRLEKKCDDLTQRIFSKLTPWQVTQLARHPMRPHTEDYLEHVFTEFDELHGDRHASDAPEIVAGVARIGDDAVMVLGHQKGRNTQEKIKRNFGMARPEGYRKALRLMTMADKFGLPIITLIDSSGAYPGIEAEQHNQSEAIARNLMSMSQLKVPVIAVVTGEGGSGGALALGVANLVYMLQYSVYSVISPEGCASILWKDADKAADAASLLGITAPRLQELGLIDAIIPEPEGGAHRDIQAHMERVKSTLLQALHDLARFSADELMHLRQDKFLAYGHC